MRVAHASGVLVPAAPAGTNLFLAIVILVGADVECYRLPMSTLQEIEAAADALPLDQKKQLIAFLASRVNGGSVENNPSDLREFAGAIRLSEDPLTWQQRVRGEW